MSYETVSYRIVGPIGAHDGKRRPTRYAPAGRLLVSRNEGERSGTYSACPKGAQKVNVTLRKVYRHATIYRSGGQAWLGAHRGPTPMGPNLNQVNQWIQIRKQT